MVFLHDFALSSASYRVRIALNLKGVDYESKSYTLREGQQRSENYLAINPAGLVPTLEIDGLQLTQSLAIIEYLDQKFPEPLLIPRDAAVAAFARAMALNIACDIHPLNNLRVLKYLGSELSLDEAQVNQWYARWVHTGFSGLEAVLTRGEHTSFAIGDTPGLVEIFLVPQLFNARRYKIDLDAYPRIVEIADRAAQLPAFVAAAPQ